MSSLSLMPLPVLGVLLAIVSIYHASLIRNLTGKRQLVVVETVAAVITLLGNLVYSFGAGILLHHLLRFLPKRLTSLPEMAKLSSRD